MFRINTNISYSRSREGAWIEMPVFRSHLSIAVVAPARERGLKFCCDIINLGKLCVAPARERGLKLYSAASSSVSACRSREGAWIEIPQGNLAAYGVHGRSREGAWIEILAGGLLGGALSVAPARERGLK